MIIVVYTNTTKEILAIIDTTSSSESVCRSDIGFKTYIDAEPILENIKDKVYLNENKFVIRVDKEQT